MQSKNVNKLLKRIIGAVMAAVLCLSVITGCTPVEPDSYNTDTPASSKPEQSSEPDDENKISISDTYDQHVDNTPSDKIETPNMVDTSDSNDKDSAASKKDKEPTSKTETSKKDKEPTSKTDTSKKDKEPTSKTETSKEDKEPTSKTETSKADTSKEEPSKPQSSSKESSEDKPDNKPVKIKGVPIIAQMPKYPTGCESVSAVMVMKYWGDSISVDKFIDKYLTKNSEFTTVDGVRYGPDPYEEFVGSPRSSSGYGCYAPVIVKALKKYYSGSYVVDTTGTSMSKLCSKYIDKGVPVLVWVSIEMREPRKTSSWYLQNGEKFTWKSHEHCMVLIGYDDDYYYYNDPYSGAEVKYSRSVSESRYKSYGKQSVVIKKH